MIARLFRFADRLARLFVKISILFSDELLTSFGAVGANVRTRLGGAGQDPHTPHTETQVQSLSGLTLLLLAAVVILIFWTTSAQGQGGAGVQILALQSTPVPGSSDLPIVPQNSEVQVPEIRSTGTLVFSMLVGGQEDLFALAAGQSAPTRLTDSLADDRSPAWSADGQRLAFASRRDGNWELYVLTMSTGEITRLTYDLAFEANPTWSPDGLWLAYEAYYDGNLDIYLVKSDASEGPYPVTHQPGPDTSPAWTPAAPGRTLAYVSLREGNQDIYLLSLDEPSEDLARNLTNTPAANEDAPAWSPDGSRIAYSVVENGLPLIYTRSTAPEESGSPQLVGQGHSPVWSPDGSELAYLSDRPMGGAPTASLLLTGQSVSWEGAVEAFILPGLASAPDWTESPLPPPQGTLAFAATAPLPGPFAEPVTAPDAQTNLYLLKNISGIVADSPILSDRVDGSFIALRDHANQAAGWDFLGRLDNVFWSLDRPLEPGQDSRNWHKAGRAFDIIEEYNSGSPAQVELVPEQIGAETYWRLYVRAAVQDGSLGEPLRGLPWDFYARTSGDVQAYERGGREKEVVPSGYYVDFTRIAHAYGWIRTPSGLTWRSNWPGILYWQYEKRDGLDWWTAMQELYPAQTLEQQFFTPTPGPTPEPPDFPEETPTNAVTGTPGPRVTVTPSVTPTRTPALPSD